MEFRILGPLEVEDEGRTIPLAGAKQRSLLALLLLARGRTVSTDRLIDEIWDGAPPETALKNVQVYVSHLRTALGDGRIVRRERGYELRVASGELDADRFDEIVRSASGVEPEAAAARLREALALFRGDPLSDLSLEPWAQPEIARLEERRLNALEARIDADLSLGRHRELVPELDALVAAHPFREHLLEQLVLALYRSGRQGEALDVHRRGAARLRSELGLEPSRAVRELEQRILRQDPALEPPPAAGVRDTSPRRGWKLILVGSLVVLAAAVATAAVTIVRRDSAGSLASVPPGVAIIDTSSGSLIAQIPWNEIRYPAIALTGDDSFWVWTLDGNSLVRIDPDGRVLRRISSPFGDATLGALVDGRSLWFSGTRLVRMDVASGSEANRYSLTDDPQSDGLAGFARGGGSLWVARQQAGELLRVDPASGTVQRRFAHLLAPYAVRFGDGGAWVVTYDSVQRIDAATNTITSTSLPPQVAEIAVGGGFAWVSNEAKGTVYKINRSGRIVATYETGDGARDMSYADGTLWVVNQDVGTVTGIDAATGVTRTFRFGHPLQTLAALKGKLLVSVNRGRTYQDRIDSLDGEVARLFGPIYEFDHPDPAISGNGYVHSFIFQAERATCAPLLGYPDVPPPRGQQLVPEVAATMPTLSRDGRTYTFTVKPGFRFAPPSNANLDTQTFRFSIERALNPKLGSRAPGIDFLGDLEGAQAFHAGHATHVSGIRVHDDRISFTLRHPSPDFLERLALPYFCPVPHGTVIKADGVGVYTGPAPPGAGPYSFSGWVWNGEYEILRRNPNYGGTRPQHLDAIAFREGIDTEKAVERVEHGGWGGIQDYNPVLGPGGEIARRFGADPRAAVSHQTFPQALTSYIALNARSGPFSDVRLRRALALGLARTTLAANGNYVATNQLLPVAVRGAETPRVGDADVGRARRLVGARHLSLNMAVQANDERSSHMADLVRAQLAPLGIDVQPRVVPDLAAALRDPKQDIHLAVLTTSLDYPDPASFLTRMLGHDVPARWLPPTTRAAVARLGLRTGAARDRAAVVLAARLGTRDVPVVAFGTQELGVVIGRSLGCRLWNGVDAGLDLAALCLPGS